MESITILFILLGLMFLLLGSGVWIGLSLMAVAGFAIDSLVITP